MFELPFIAAFQADALRAFADNRSMPPPGGVDVEAEAVGEMFRQMYEDEMTRLAREDQLRFER